MISFPTENYFAGLLRRICDHDEPQDNDQTSKLPTVGRHCLLGPLTWVKNHLRWSLIHIRTLVLVKLSTIKAKGMFIILKKHSNEFML